MVDFTGHPNGSEGQYEGQRVEKQGAFRRDTHQKFKRLLEALSMRSHYHEIAQKYNSRAGLRVALSPTRGQEI